MASNEVFGLVNTAQNNLTSDYEGEDPFAPAGINDTTRTGWLTGLSGLTSNLAGAEDYASSMSELSDASTNAYLQNLESGAFSTNEGLNRASSGYDSALANQINQTGASFDVNNPYLDQQVQTANEALARDFQQGTMPALNLGLANSGQGAYGGTRAGVAQGLREQSLADAMANQTTNLYAQGYESGLDRYVSDRANTLSAVSSGLSTAGTAGANQLAQGNEMYQWGSNNLLPENIERSYEAGQTVGDATVGLGTAVEGIGSAIQSDDQAYLDWVNNQFNQANNYGTDRTTTYANTVGDYLQPGTSSSGTTSGETTASSGNNNIANAVGALSTGYGVYDTISNQNGDSNSTSGTTMNGSSTTPAVSSNSVFGSWY